MPQVLFNITQVARSVPFDNSGTDFQSTNVQDAITEIGASASPGFSYSRSGTVNPGSFLLCDSVPSNVSSRVIALTSAKIRKVFVANETATAFSFNIYEHNGNFASPVLITTITTAAANTNVFSVSLPVSTGRQIAINVAPGASAKNVVIGLQLQGGL